MNEIMSSDVATERPTFPYRITFVDCAPSPAVQFRIERALKKLERHHPRITAAEVAVRIPHKSRGPRFFHIHVQLDVPGQRFVVTREPESTEKRTDIRTAVRDAFHKLTRQLEDFQRTRLDRHRAGESASPPL